MNIDSLMWSLGPKRFESDLLHEPRWREADEKISHLRNNFSEDII